MKITVLGATGGIGRAIATELIHTGHDVVTANRAGNANIEGGLPAAADLTVPGGAREAVRGTDVVVMAAQPGGYRYWAKQWPGMLDNALDAAAAAQARFVYVDNLYMYAPATGPISTSSPEHATTAKGRLRRELGERVLSAGRSGTIPGAVIGRFSDYYGPGGTNSSLHMLAIRPALAGQKMRGFIALDEPHSSHYLPDVARGFARLVTDDRGDGQAWIMPAAPPLMQRQMLQLLAEATGAPTDFGRVSPTMLRLAAVVLPSLRGTGEVINQFDRPWVVDGRAFTETFGEIPITSHEDAVAQTVAWFRAHPDT